MKSTFNVTTVWAWTETYAYTVDEVPDDWDKLSPYDKFMFLETSGADAGIVSQFPDKLLDVLEVVKDNG